MQATSANRNAVPAEPVSVRRRGRAAGRAGAKLDTDSDRETGAPWGRHDQILPIEHVRARIE